ncbi:hypothetical protein HDU93_003770 [Gonapodya sp. JEL0774]|nr:hypothetical protein HDU93_003770 [Gonapodya sp. JEL0774]
MSDEHLKMEGDEDRSAASWSREEEAALVRKLDLRLMPFAMSMFFVAYLDRGNISNARTANGTAGPDSFEASLGTACNNKTGIIVCRLLVGVAEAGLLPGLLFWIGFWYRKYEIATRTALIHGMLAFSSAFAGLIATGIGRMNGTAGLPTWRWIFIIEAIPSIVLCIATIIWMPNFPHTSQNFLSPREMQIAIARLPPSAPSHLQKHFDRTIFLETIKDPMNLIYPVFFAIGVIPQLALQYFIPTILQGMGYTGALSNLMSAPPNLYAFILEIANAVHSDYTQERVLHILWPATFGLIGYVLLPISGQNGWPVGSRYFLLFVANTGIANAPAWYSWRQNMTIGATAVAFVMGWTNSVVNIAGAVSPFLFPTADAPVFYQTGGFVGAGCFAISMVGAVVVYFYDNYRRKNGYYDAIEAEAKRELENMNAMFEREAGFGKA